MNWNTLVAMLLIPSLVAAEEEPSYRLPPLIPELKVELTSIPEGEDQIVLLERGSPAPFSGQLFSSGTALRWGNWLEQYRVQTPLLLDTQSRMCLTEIQYRDSVIEVKDDAAEKIQEDLMARLERVEEKNAHLQAQLNRGPRWYQGRTFGIVVGAVGSFGFTMLSIWALDASKK